MNKFVKEQLEKVESVKLNYDDNTTHIVINRITTIKLEEDSCYLIELNDSLLTNTVLQNNWNNGSLPNSKWYMCDITKIMGNMVKINGIAYDNVNKVELTEMWSGWLLKEQINILSRI